MLSGHQITPQGHTSSEISKWAVTAYMVVSSPCTHTLLRGRPHAPRTPRLSRATCLRGCRVCQAQRSPRAVRTRPPRGNQKRRKRSEANRLSRKGRCRCSLWRSPPRRAEGLQAPSVGRAEATTKSFCSISCTLCSAPQGCCVECQPLGSLCGQTWACSQLLSCWTESVRPAHVFYVPTETGRIFLLFRVL